MKKLVFKSAKKSKKKACPGRIVLKILWKILVFLFIAFLSTFIIYFFNLENKLIYNLVRPFLNNHYDKQVRDRRI